MSDFPSEVAAAVAKLRTFPLRSNTPRMSRFYIQMDEYRRHLKARDYAACRRTLSFIAADCHLAAESLPSVSPGPGEES